MVVYCGGILRYYRSVQVVGFFDVAARLCTGDGPIAALVGGASWGSVSQHRTFNDYKNNITV